MVNSIMEPRFHLGLRPATTSCSSLFNRKADGIDRNASAFPDRFTLETLLVPAEASHSSLFALSSRSSEIFAPLFSITCALFFTLCKRTTRHLASFQSLPHSLRECQGSPPSSPKYAHQAASARPPARCRAGPPNPPTPRTGSCPSPLFPIPLFLPHPLCSLPPPHPL